MAKSKKKHSKKDKVSENILDMAALSVKKFRKATREIGKLSTGQKVVGGLALVAVGLTYLAQQRAEPAEPAPDHRDASRQLAASHPGATADGGGPDEFEDPPAPLRKSRKGIRSK